MGRANWWAGVAAGVLASGCMDRWAVPARDVEQAAGRYLDAMYPGRHGPPVCEGMTGEGTYTTCDVLADGAPRRLACTRPDTSHTDVTHVTCAYLCTLGSCS